VIRAPPVAASVDAPHRRSDDDSQQIDHLPRQRSGDSALAAPLPMGRHEYEPGEDAPTESGNCSSVLDSQPDGATDMPIIETTSTRKSVALSINGDSVNAEVDTRLTLLDFLRERARLTGSKKGCNRGECGTCTLLVDGRRVNACMILMASLEGRRVTTIEGLATKGQLHPVQEAFIDHDAFQCGFCTPGQIMSAVGCINEGHANDPAEIREWMSGNLCRCSAYPQIVAAVRAGAEALS
jgi:xanthine dehydrogenase YagT iron-sulfur-binding subunit